MIRHVLLVIICLLSFSSFGQVNTGEPVKTETTAEENDSILDETILLDDVYIYKDKLDPEAKKQFLILQNRVYKVYPYARLAAEKMTTLNANLNKLKSKRDKKRYYKIVEDYMENEFKAQLKKLSRKQGQILVKLIYRQTGITTFDIIKDYKSGWNAFWSSNTAKLFDLNLKAKYSPYDVNEDYLIETILYRAFSRGRLVEQKAANPVELDELNAHWIQKAQEQSKVKN